MGADFFARRGAVAARDPAPRGVVDRMVDLGNHALDVARIHPAIVPFFEDTASLDVHVRTRWPFPLSLLWPLARPLLAAIGQLVLPRREAVIETRVLGLDPARDGRSDARAIVRTYKDTGAVMQAMAYATFEHEGTRYMSAAIPMPGGQIAGFLRLDAIGEDDEGRLAVALSSYPRDGDLAGVRICVGPIAVRGVLHERLELFAAGSALAPEALREGGAPDAVIVGRHEQRLFGLLLVRHLYWFVPARTGGEAP